MLREAGPPRLLYAAIALAIVLGVALRFGSIAHKPWWADELATLVVLAGCTDADLQRAYDGRPHTAEELLACHRVSAQRGYGDLARAVLDEGPQNLPFFFVAARALTRWLDWEWAPRLVSAIASSLALAAGAALGRALLGSWLAGGVVAALAAVSPLHVRFGLDARDYSLWSLFTVLAAWLLLRAYASNRRADWLAYAAAQTLALHANLLASPSALAMLGWGLVAASKPRLGPGSPLRRHVAALAVAGATLVPWASVVLMSHGTVRRTLDWTTLPMPLAELGRRWFGNLTEVFLRTGADGGLVGGGNEPWIAGLRLAIGVGVVLVLLASLWLLVRTTPPRVWAFPLFLGGPLFVALVLADVVLGGRRSMMARYVLPAWWAAELVIAGGFVGGLALARSVREVRAASAALAILLVLGAWSSVRATALEVWWDTDPPVLRAQLAEAGRARGGASPGGAVEPTYWILDAPKYQLLGFAHLVPPGTRFVLESQPPDAAAAGCTPLELFTHETGAPEARVLRCDGATLPGDHPALP